MYDSACDLVDCAVATYGAYYVYAVEGCCLGSLGGMADVLGHGYGVVVFAVVNMFIDEA